VKLQAPNPKLQGNIKHQAPNSSRTLSLGAWDLMFLWFLELGAWSFRQRTLGNFGLVLLVSSAVAGGASPDASFRDGTIAYHAGDYSKAAEAFRQSATQSPASGTLQNLGLAEWQRGRIGDAIVAWEQALWLAPFNQSARTDLRFARKAAQIEAPELSWNEVVSTWLPVNWWAWIAGGSLWISVGTGILPGVLRRPKAAWHQALGACGVMLFLLSVPAHLGVHTRSLIGFVVEKQVPLRLTPTGEAQALTQLAAGDPARFVRARGNYIFVRTSRAKGWIERAQFHPNCPNRRPL